MRNKLGVRAVLAISALFLFISFHWTSGWVPPLQVPSFTPSRHEGRFLLPNKVLFASTVSLQKESSLQSLSTEKERRKLQGKLLKQMRQVALDYDMLQEGDHIMVCVSGGKDSATLLYLLIELQRRLPINFNLTAVHVNQHQPGYNGTALVQWLQDELNVNYHIVEEDTYSIVVNKTQEGKSYCTVCSRLRRGILYTTALSLGCNKICLGHHGDDALETLLLNMMHASQLKSMPARYTSKRGNLAVMRPLITSLEDDIARFASLSNFPILPCNLCSNQANLQRPRVKLLLSTLDSFTPYAKENMIKSMMDVRPTHLLDQSMREVCGLDPITGQDVNCTFWNSDSTDDEDDIFLL